MSILRPTQKDFLLAKISKTSKELENYNIDTNGCTVYYSIHSDFKSLIPYIPDKEFDKFLDRHKRESIWLYWFANVDGCHIIEVPWGLNNNDKKINGCLRYKLKVDDRAIRFVSKQQLHEENDGFAYLYDFKVDDEGAIGISLSIKDAIRGTITEIVRKFILNSIDPEGLRTTLKDNKDINYLCLDEEFNVYLSLDNTTVNIE